MTDASRADEVRRDIESWRPPSARALALPPAEPPAGLLRSPPMGGKRGRPPLGGEGADRAPRWSVSMSPAAIAWAKEYGELYGRGERTLACRELVEAWGEDKAIREAVAAWHERRNAARRAAREEK